MTRTWGRLLAGGLLIMSAVGRGAGAALAAAQAETNACPPTPQWFQDLTRVAYTDLGNVAPSGDWPVKVLDDLAAAGAQLFISRCHSGEGWDGLGWKSQYGEIDSRLKGSAVDWEIAGGELTDADAHTGRHSLRLTHDGIRGETYLNRRWKPDDGQQGAMLGCLKGTISFWYKALSGKGASLWLGVVPMSTAPREAAKRAGIMIPAEHVGDGQDRKSVV